MIMSCYFWMMLGASLFLISLCSSQQLSPLCLSNTQTFHMENPQLVPRFCTHLQLRFNPITYRINFTESEVNNVCNSDICRALMTDIVLSCSTFAKKDINCLDSPGLIHVWCSNSNVYDNTSCFTSLSNQGVIDTPNLFTPCLNAMNNAESCPDYCRNIFMNADCCFVSYYAFMLDAFVGSGGFLGFDKTNFVRDRFWGWCNVTSPGICPGLNLTDYSPRNNSVTCDFQPIDISTVSPGTPNSSVTMAPTMLSTPTPGDSSGSTIIQQPPIGILIIFTFLIISVSV